jgi:hypothetical protein
MSTFSPVWEVVADDAGAVDAGVGGQDAVAALPFDLAVGLLLRRGFRWVDPIASGSAEVHEAFVEDGEDGENEWWGCSSGVGAGMAAVVAMQCVGRCWVVGGSESRGACCCCKAWQPGRSGQRVHGGRSLLLIGERGMHWIKHRLGLAWCRRRCGDACTCGL